MALVDKIRQSLTLGKGLMLFRESGRTGYDDMLEVDDFKFSQAVEKVEKNTSRDSSVAQIASIVKSTKVTGSFSCNAPLLQVMRFFTMSKEVKDVSQTSGTLSYQQFTASLNRWIELGKVNLSDVFVRKNAGVTFTVDAGTDVITSNAHGFTNGQAVSVGNSGGAIPTGLVADTIYYVRDADTNTLKLAATSGGAAIDITNAGSGTHTLYRAYRKNIDYEIKTGPGLLYASPDGAITDGLAIAVKATYPQQSMFSLEGFTKTNMEGDIAFYGDSVAGVKQDFFGKARLTPSGDFSMIGEDIQKFQVDFEIVLSTNENGDQIYYTFRDRSGLSVAVPAA